MEKLFNFVPSLGTYSAAPQQLKQASLHSACTSIVRQNKSNRKMPVDRQVLLRYQVLNKCFKNR